MTDHEAFEPQADIAARYARSRPGYDLVSVCEIGLPVYRLSIRADLLDRKPIPPIEEFALKALQASLTSVDEVGQLLGLDLRTAERAIAGLCVSDDVVLAAPPGTKKQQLKLTEKGEATLAAAEQIVPVEERLRIFFDGLLRRVMPIRQDALIPGKLLDEEGGVPIDPYPVERPQLEDVRIDEIETLLRWQGSAERRKRDIVGLKAIERRDLLYRPGYALVFKARDSHEIQIAFAVDGVLSDEHERRFALADGPKKTGLLQGLRDESEFERILSDLKAEHGDAIPGRDEVNAHAKAVEAAEAEVDRARVSLGASQTSDDRAAAEQALQAATNRRNTAQAALEALPVRQLAVHEHWPLLQEALETATERLLIETPWIKRPIVNWKFLAKVRSLLERGVRLFIGYGINEIDDTNHAEAVEDLERLAERFDNFTLTRLNDTHSKVLIVDRKFCVTGSFNWLSFRGDPKRTFRDERGTLVAIPTFVEDQFEYHANRILYQEDPEPAASAANARPPIRPTPPRTPAPPTPAPAKLEVARKPSHDAKPNPVAPAAIPPAKKPLRPADPKTKRVRVYDLAHRLNVTNNDILNISRELGQPLSVPSNTVPDPLAEQIRLRLGRAGERSEPSPPAGGHQPLPKAVPGARLLRPKNKN